MPLRTTGFLAGLIFGWGLILSGMTDPGKVLGFLDLAGNWDPSLAFVMAGAITVAIGAFSWARRRTTALTGAAMELPSARRIDGPLMVGALMFGVGWGLAGFCPAPALVSIAMGHPKAIAFVLAMVAGMLVHEFTVGRRTGSVRESTSPKSE